MWGPLFADAVPTWTDKEVLATVLKSVGGTIAVAVTLASVIVPILNGSLRRRNRELDERVKVLDAENAALNGGLVQELKGRIAVQAAELDDLRVALAKTEERLAVARELTAATRNEAAGYKAVAEAVTGERDVAITEAAAVTAERDAALKRIRKAATKDGATWTEKVLLTKKVDFTPLDGDERRTPIVSVLNLKGGVGKTTATASLASVFAHRGYRVLLLDLDLQGSLSSLFLSDQELTPLYAGNRLMADYLEAAFDAEFPNLLDYARPVGLPGKSMLVPTTDGMAYAETTLNLRWFLREEAARDPRFLLRRELHLKRITNAFDVVLIDCPPLLTAGCLNGLMASDYVLVPVTPSKPATDRVTVLLDRLKEFKGIHPDLKPIGVFANRTSPTQPGLTADERNRLSALAAKCQDAWGLPVPVLDSYIKQSVEVRDAEDERRTLGPTDDSFAAFDRLAREIEDRLPMFCRPLKPSGQPQLVSA